MKHHPPENVIHQFTAGDLLEPVATLISAHLDHCQLCQSKYAVSLNKESSDFIQHNFEVNSKDLENSFDQILNRLSNLDPSIVNPPPQDEVNIEVSGRILTLPRSMNFLKDQTIGWKEFGKTNAIAPLKISAEGNFYLIYIGPGESVPHHDHTGVEYSYVVAGSYEDGASTYQTGDFSFSKKGDYHTPTATSADGCLVISWVEGRLNYLTGIFKPLNSLLWWYLHRA